MTSTLTTELDILLMVEIVRLGRRQEREVISAVWDGRRDERQDKEEQSGGKVRAHEQRAKYGRQHVAEHVLHGMCVDRRDTDRRRPLVVHLVDAAIQVRMVEQAAPTNSSVFTCIGALGTPSRTGPLARKYSPGFPYSWSLRRIRQKISSIYCTVICNYPSAAQEQPFTVGLFC